MLIGLLAAGAIAVPLARRIGMPLPVLLAALGLAVGTVSLVYGVKIAEPLGFSDRLFVERLALDTNGLLYFFLPPLLFEMAIAVNTRRLVQDAAAVLVMAILAVVAATAIVGVSLSVVSHLGLAVCLLLGAAVATTDPGAVIATFREIGAPRRLLVILEGESLLNDAAAIAIFGLLIGILSKEIAPSLSGLFVDFLYSFGAGAAVGLAVAAVAGWIYPLFARSTVAEVSITVVVAYGSFLAAEQAFGGSGVVAVVFAGLATGSSGFLRMGPGNWQTVRTIWAQIGFWSNTAIMILATALVPTLLAAAGWRVLPYTLLVYAGAMAARAMILFGLLPLMARLGLTEPLSAPQAGLVLWGGVRGSVTLLLAISISHLEVLGEDGPFLASLAAAYTLATVFVNASTLSALTRLLGLNRLAPAELALRERIIAGTIESVRGMMRDYGRERDFEPEALSAVQRTLGQRRREIDAAADEQAALQRIPFGERLRLGLAIISGQEIRMIGRTFDGGAISPQTARTLRADAERLADAGRSGGRERYEEVLKGLLRPRWRYRAGVAVQRWLRADRVLRRAIEEDFIRLLEWERLVRELKRFAANEIGAMIGVDAARNLVQLMERRHAGIETEIEAIAAQYPAYAMHVEENLIARAALRRERQQYLRLLDDGVIEQELFDNLNSELDALSADLSRPPRLDLTLTPLTLLERVPLFAGLDPAQRRIIAKALRTRFTTPGEVILETGARGTEMFFIASGAFEVEEGPRRTRLGTGDFFGEVALVYPLRRRGSRVVSLGYCRVLVLHRRDFQKLAGHDPSLEELIRKAAEQQLAVGYAKPPPLVLPGAAD